MSPRAPVSPSASRRSETSLHITRADCARICSPPGASSTAYGVTMSSVVALDRRAARGAWASRRESRPQLARRRGGRRPAPPAASCWRAGSRHARRCRRPRRRRRVPARSSRPGIHRDAAHEVVRGGRHGNQIGGEVEPVARGRPRRWWGSARRPRARAGGADRGRRTARPRPASRSESHGRRHRAGPARRRASSVA